MQCFIGPGVSDTGLTSRMTDDNSGALESPILSVMVENNSSMMAYI